jgi:hypothetical protein
VLRPCARTSHSLKKRTGGAAKATARRIIFASSSAGAIRRRQPPQEGKTIVAGTHIQSTAPRNCSERVVHSNHNRMAVFQPAKKPATGPQFLQIVAEPEAVTRPRKPEPKLTRVAFRVSRLMEFCTKRELQNQTGHSVHQWLLVVLKELMDNALDACEEAEIAPVISIKVNPDAGTIIIQDNAAGIKTDTIKSILDYTIRVSSREAYISPTRGAQGNALKTILAMGYVLNREKANGDDAVGVTIIETRGVKHRIKFEVDHINLQPRVTHDTTPSSLEVGTQITIQWPPKAELFSWAAYHVNGVVHLVQPAPDASCILERQGIHQRQGDESELGEVATAQPDQSALV